VKKSVRPHNQKASVAPGSQQTMQGLLSYLRTLSYYAYAFILLFRIMMTFTILLKKIMIFVVANLCISYLHDVVGWNAYI
jgi:hypothetical protein